MVKAKKFIYAKAFQGIPKVTDFRLEEEILPRLDDGEVLVKAVYLSVDPFARAYSPRIPIGFTMIGSQISKVLESKSEEFRVGEFLFGDFGWQTHTIFNPNYVDHLPMKPYKLPSFGNLPLSLGLGHLGMPGNSAYFGFLDYCEPKDGDVVVVSGAAGAVGSIVGQIAKIKNCTVIGIAGSDDKCKWITKEIGFDHAINYKTENISKMLRKYAPNGVDCYFDNVGGELSSLVIHQMRDFGRIAICGSISTYNLRTSERPKVPCLEPIFVTKQLKMQGFVYTNFKSKWFGGIKQMQDWISEGKIKYRETITNGFENMPNAFINMLQGQNFGKAVVQIQSSCKL